MANDKTGAKQPWQMTRRQYDKNLFDTEGGFQTGIRDIGEAEARIRMHKEYITEALSEGKPVPSEVLAEYPDLAAKYSKQQPSMPPQIAALHKIIDSPDTSPAAKLKAREELKKLLHRLEPPRKQERESAAISAIHAGKSGKKIVDVLMNEVILYGGFPMTRANVYRQVLEDIGEEKAADLFAFGGTTKLAPEGMEPMTREQFKEIIRQMESKKESGTPSKTTETAEEVGSREASEWKSRAALSRRTAPQQLSILLPRWIKAKLGYQKDAIRSDIEKLLPDLTVADVDKLLSELPAEKFTPGGGISERDLLENLLKEIRRKIAAFASPVVKSEPTWSPFEVKGKKVIKDGKGYAFKDPRWGYTDKAALEQSLQELKSHIGEKVYVSGGGGSGGFTATLRGGHIEEWNVKDGEERRWGIKADLLADEKVMGKRDFDPWLDSWRISFAAGVTKKAKSTSNVTSQLQGVESSRSPRSKSSDESQEHSVIIEAEDPRVSTWKRDPGRMDVRGIDTPKKQHKRRSKLDTVDTQLGSVRSRR